MADMEWLLRRSREIAREMAAVPEWERASLQAQLLELGKPREPAVEDDRSGASLRESQAR